MKRLIVIGISTILLLLWSMIFAQTILEIHQQGLDLFNQQKYEEAKEKFLIILKDQKNDKRGEAYLHLMKCYYFLRDHAGVEQTYKQYHSQFAETIFDPATRFVRANSLLDNANAPALAEKEYEYIIQRFPQSPFAAPGSLYQLGLINLERYKNYDRARQKFTDLISQYPESPYIPRAWLGILKASAEMIDVKTMLSAFNYILSNYSESKNVIAEAHFALGEFYNNKVYDRNEATKYYLKIVNDYPNSSAEPLALLRAADNVPDGLLPNAISLYRKYLEKYPKSKNAPWAQIELAFCYYVLGQEEAAREEFQKVLSMSTSRKYLDKANFYLEAINNPQSVSALKANFDAGFKKMEYLNDLDTSFKNFVSVIDIYENSSDIEKYLTSNSTPVAEKAAILYKVALSYHNIGNMLTARELIDRILTEYKDNDIGEIKAYALYSQAYYYRYLGRNQEALLSLVELVSQFPNFKYTPRSLLLMALLYDISGDPLSAAQVNEYVKQAYPHTIWAKQAEFNQQAVLLGREEIAQQFIKLKEKNHYTIFTTFNISPNDRYLKGIKQLLDQLAILNKTKSTRTLVSK